MNLPLRLPVAEYGNAVDDALSDEGLLEELATTAAC